MLRDLQERAVIVKAIILLLGGVILLRLAYMQLIVQSYRVQADAATIEKQVVDPSRGLILDRHGTLLVHNQPMYDLYVTYNLLSKEMDVAKMCRVLDIGAETFRENISKDWSSVRFDKNVPFLFLAKVDAITFAGLQEILHEYPGFSIKKRTVRGYEHPNAAHVLGYISEVDQKTIDESDGMYETGDYIGVSGLEAIYERELKGNKGLEYLLKDNFGRTVGSYDEGDRDLEARAGSDLHVTIDIELQSYAEQLMGGKTGSVVAIEPSTGEILTLLSSPDYDPADLSASADRAESFRDLRSDSLKPFFNRAIMAKYPPGSTFKPVLALIALQEGVLTPTRFITCKGAYYYKIYRWGCHARPGVRNVVRAVEESCNTFFYTIYRELIDRYGFDEPAKGLDALNNHLYDFGLGDPLRIDLPEESGGLIPTDEFYRDVYEDKGEWRSTYIVSNGIGQGEVELTTLQMANLAVILGNRGFYYRPHLIKSFSSHAIEKANRFQTPKRVNVEDQYFDPVIDGMERSIYLGTSKLAQVPGHVVCGKTGTSENPHGKDHSVFFAFAPRENPQIAVAVFVENAGWGASYAAPIAGLIMEKYLNGYVDPSRLWLEDRMIQANLLADL
ncbi:MAG: penicillin-binding protein 2 [Saprospiraceae bacterium]|nr:penicillin-binding protein 2 [Saprospiraceae bacterium]